MPTGKNKPGTRPPGRMEGKMDISQMQSTCSLKFVIEREVRDDPFGAYIKYNLAEIRKACLKRISEIRDIYSCHAEWAEGVIEHLRKECNDDWKKIIDWYIYAADYKIDFGKDDPTLGRAIEFALSLAHDEEGLISKLLAGRLQKGTFSIEIYDKMPALKSFFHGLLRNFYWQEWWWKGKTRSGEYGDEAWYRVIRALDVFVLAGDFSMIDEINDIIVLMEKGVIFPDPSAHWAAKYTRITHLKAAKMSLEKAKYEAEEEETKEGLE